MIAIYKKIRSLLFFSAWVIRRSVSPKVIELYTETPCLCPSEGHKHGGRKVIPVIETYVIEF